MELGSGGPQLLELNRQLIGPTRTAWTNLNSFRLVMVSGGPLSRKDLAKFLRPLV